MYDGGVSRCTPSRVEYEQGSVLCRYPKSERLSSQVGKTTSASSIARLRNGGCVIVGLDASCLLSTKRQLTKARAIGEGTETEIREKSTRYQLQYRDQLRSESCRCCDRIRYQPRGRRREGELPQGWGKWRARTYPTRLSAESSLAPSAVVSCVNQPQPHAGGTATEA